MPQIQQLPPDVINKIAAGEVIERPASVVKELMENSIDAGATRIEVSLQQGGLQAIRISDNGHGIAPEQLPLAVASHATSKIRDADDLFRVGTLGFRGEALASIAAVSHMRIRCRTEASEAGAELLIQGGKLGEIEPCGCPAGTTTEVSDLFFNTPVRRKFMRTTQTEVGHASEAFTRIALANPQVHLTLRHNDRTLHDLPPSERWRDRIASLFGDPLAEGLMWVEGGDEQANVSGYVADPQFSRAANRMQYLFLNGRHIRDRSLQHALGEAYRGLLMTGRFPIVFLKLELPADAVDVNVHPAKLEVRFVDSGRLYSQLLGTIRGKFLATDLTARVGPTSESVADSAATAHDAARTQQHLRELVEWAHGGTSSAAVPQQQSEAARSDSFVTTPTHPVALGGQASAIEPSPQQAEMTTSSPPQLPPPRVTFGSGQQGMQMQNRYLVTENDQGIVVIDQHALHERVLYEELREKMQTGKLETQNLLVPETVSMTAAEAAAALDARESLAQLGIRIEPFGGDTILVSSYPAMLANVSPSELVRHVVDQLMDGGRAPERRDILDELLHMISCKAAVKAGDRLSAEEVTVLLEQRDLCQDSHHCPHGRPTALVFTRDELDKRFRRT